MMFLALSSPVLMLGVVLGLQVFEEWALGTHPKPSTVAVPSSGAPGQQSPRRHVLGKPHPKTDPAITTLAVR